MPPKLQWMSCKQPRESSGTVRPNRSSNRSFHAPGRSATVRSPDSSASSSSNRRTMCRLYVASSASTRMSDGAHVVDREVERVRRHVRERAGERLLEPREEVVPERPAAADLVLPQPRLRLVDAERARDAERRAEVVGRKVLLVERVAGLVQHAEERLVEEPRVVARGDAAVAGADARSRTGARWCRAGRRRSRSRTRPRPTPRTASGGRPGTRVRGSPGPASSGCRRSCE